MIPKIIHYCWFGRGTKNQKIQDYIAGWHKLMPEYQIIEWNEDNFDIHSTLWTEQAYEAKKWAFVSDYVRLLALYQYGGIYFDTDVEVLKPLDRFLNNDLLLGFEAKDMPTTAIIGSRPNNPFIQRILTSYRSKAFIKSDGSYDMTPNPYIFADFLSEIGVKWNGREQAGSSFHIYSSIVFSPNSFSRIWEKPSAKSYTIHHFDQSWREDKRNTLSFSGRLRRYLVGVARNTFGTKKARDLSQACLKLFSGKTKP